MKGKSYAIPVGMVFKKYYCCKCGTKLEKERTHRVVNKEDKDYYQYQDCGTFPRVDHDVYDYRFKCPNCGKRISYDEQCIMERIQKKSKSKILSSKEIKNNYQNCKHNNNKYVLTRNIMVPSIFIIPFFILFYIFKSDKSLEQIIGLTSIFVIISILVIIGAIRSYKGNYKLRIYKTYSHEERTKIEKLHSYSSHNKDLISKASKCYCFYCKHAFDSNEINNYIDDGQTALCPNCDIDSIIPDSIDEKINESIIDEMNKYWF